MSLYKKEIIILTYPNPLHSKNILKTDASPVVLISSVIALLHKYASYISDSITIEVRLNEEAISNVTKIVSETVLFSDFQRKIQQDLPGHFISPLVTGDILYFKWITENNYPGTEYQFVLTKIDPSSFSFESSSVENGFFQVAFKNVHQHLQNLLDSLSANSKILLRDINYISNKEKDKITLYNKGIIDKDVNAPELLHLLFEQTAEKYSDYFAIVSSKGGLTYYELNTKANRLAELLIENNVKPGDFVGILLKRTPEVYISILAILKTGAAYVPIDTSSPEDRITYILNDCHARLLISNHNSYPKPLNLSCPLFLFDEELYASLCSIKREGSPEVIQTTQSPAYIIYTSGSSGRPKGVIISHASVSNLVKAEDKIFQLKPSDKVAQGFSVSFDASVEEIWLAFRSGAALFPVSEEKMVSGTELSGFIRDNKITVLSTIPTMLSMMQGPLSSLRLLILGGENCPHELLQKWVHPNVRIVNTYGPTETTVIATYTDFNPNKRITIGKPLINYSTYIFDKNLLQVAIGVPGELCIAGVGLASGYLNNRELTDEKFITARYDESGNHEKRIYRTGDLVRMNNEGNIEFLGRIDSQVKLRGYRIELSEIESQLIQLTEVKNALVIVKEDEFKVKRLIAYIILKNNPDHFDEHSCKKILKSRLADYMIPSTFIVLSEFPLLPSGKVDIKKLPEPGISVNNRYIIEPKNDFEKDIYRIWKKYLPTQQVSVSDDFFDLGGHSLLAALVMSEMRNEPAFGRVSVQDIYTFRTIEKLADYISKNAMMNPGPTDKTDHSQKQKQVRKKVSRLTFTMTSILQFLSFFLFYSIESLGLLIPIAIGRTSFHIYTIIVISVLGLFIWIPFLIMLSIVVKWCVIGRFKEGRYPLWGWYYFRFWLVKKLVDLAPINFISGTPFINVYFRLMGTKIGKGVYLGSDRIRIFDLIKIGDHSSISRQANLPGYYVQNGELIIGRINIGTNCFIGACSVISEDSGLKNNSSLGELSLLRSGEYIPENEFWQGSPAVKTNIENTFQGTKQQTSKSHPFSVYLLFQSMAVLFVLLFPLILVIPFAVIFYKIVHHLNLGFALLSIIPNTGLYIILYCSLVTLLKWIIIGKVKEEEFSIYSFRYIQKWTVDMLNSMSLIYFRSIYATIYIPFWLRSLGVKIGKASEISTVNHLNTDLLEIGNGSFLADSVSIGTPEVRNNIMSIKKISIGEKTFIGNSAVISGGKKIGNNMLIGVLSTPPPNEADRCKDDSSWLGSPPMFLPKRQTSKQFPVKQTFNPNPGLYLRRGSIELIKITIPYIISSTLITLIYIILNVFLNGKSLMHLFWITPILLFLFFLTTPFFTFFVKKLLIGRYKQSNNPLWSLFVWKNELVNSLCENLVYPLLINITLGTPFAPLFFKLMGAKIGKNVFMETTEITEFDLVTIGDHVCLNHQCTIQTHLFEDRVMKMSYLKIGNQCNVGIMAVVLYDSVMENASSLSSLSLVMKGEVIPTGTRWAGSPAKFTGSIMGSEF